MCGRTETNLERKPPKKEGKKEEKRKKKRMTERKTGRKDKNHIVGRKPSQFVIGFSCGDQEKCCDQ